ncbi:EamA family transporter [Cyanobium sp. Aljojuca 7D2]|nr:EamA family transporter [Cyanobium sp. Aljojuca 7D2]
MEPVVLIDGQQAAAELPAARPAAPQQNGSEPQSRFHLAERVRPAPPWHGSTKRRFVGWNVAQRQASSFDFPLLKARRTVQNWQLWATAAALSAAVTALLIKVGVQGVDAGLATLFRTVAVAVVLGLVLLANGRLDWQELSHLPAASLTALTLSGLATGVSWFCYSRALQLGPVAGVAALDKLSVVLIAVLALVFLGEPLDIKAWLGVVLMAAGAALVAWV